jgi:hypothetical protein
MKWNDLLYEYEQNLLFINRQRKYHSHDYALGMYRMLRLMIHQMRIECEDLPEIDYTTNIPTFSYRGKDYEVHFDDAGQQMYLTTNGVVLSGGAFNNSPELEWMEQLDDFIDTDFCPWLVE